MSTKKILVATELDELSEKVTKFAANLSVQLGAPELILLNVIIPLNAQTISVTGGFSTYNPQDISLFNSQLMKKHESLVANEASKFSTEKVTVKPAVRFNDSKTDLNGYMEHFNADIVVFGSHDENNFLNQIFGVDSEEVVRKVDYPSIILKNETKHGDIKKILVAIDVYEKKQSGLKDIAGFARLIEAKMQLLHVTTNEKNSPDETIEKLNSLAKNFDFENYSINVVNNNNLEDGIKSFVRKNNPDMIAVQSQGKGKIWKLIFGSTTQDIIDETDKPVFVSKIK